LEKVESEFYTLTAHRFNLEEIFSMTPSSATAFNLVPGLAMDLRQVSEWYDSSCRDEFDTAVTIEKPLVVIGSPPTASSGAAVAYKGFDMVKEVTCWMDFCVDMYRKQHQEGRYFLHEHPIGKWGLGCSEIANPQ